MPGRLTPLALCLLCAGVTLILLASFLNMTSRAVMRSLVEDGVKMDSSSKFDDRLESADEDYDVHIWNVTNLEDVLEKGAKPNLDLLKFPMKDKETNFDLKFVDDRELFEYKSWWTYLPKDEEVAARMNESNIVQLNPVYLGAVAEFGGSETAMFVGLSYVAVQAVVAILEGLTEVLKPVYVDAYTAAFGEEPDVESTEYVQFATGTNLTSWDEVVAAQFGAGTLSSSFGFDSVLPIVGSDTVLVAPELFGAYGVSLSLQESIDFLGNFSQPNDFFTSTTEEQLEYPGVTVSNLATIIEYLYSYLTETMFLKGFTVGYYRVEGTEASDPRGETSLYLVDGLGKFNSGLFTRRSANEILFGYHDRIFDIIPESLSSRPLEYDGILGPIFESPEAQRDANSPLIYLETTGKKNFKKTRQYKKWRNTTFVQTRDQLPSATGFTGSCETWEMQGYESCDIFLEPIEFRDTPKSQVEPFNPKKNYEMWVPEVLRIVSITFDKITHVRGIRGRKYVVKDSAFLTGNCSFETPCNPENARYRMNGPSYVAPMYTSNGGAPSSLSQPLLGQMDEKWRSLFTGMGKYDQGKHETYVVIEPLTGFFIEGKKRLQYNWDLTREMLSTWTPLFNRSDTVYFPYLWFDNNDKISRGAARFFKNSFYVGSTVTLVFIILFAIFGVCCIAAAGYLMTSYRYEETKYNFGSDEDRLRVEKYDDA